LLLRRTTAIAACAVLGLAACSDDDSGGDASDTTEADETTTTAGVEPLTIMVTNDDGIGHTGIDTLVTAVEELHDVEVVVVAPADDRTGTSDTKTEGGASYAEASTKSGHEATAVDGFPADTVTVALDDLGLEPDLVVSGINQGQNAGPLGYLSGTVGAAREAIRRGVPAIAGSAGMVDDADFAGAAALLVAYIEEHRSELADGTVSTDAVTNFNVPECTAGEPRELIEVALATEIPAGVTPFTADCTIEPAEAPTDDVLGLAAGYAVVSPVPPEDPAG
jgi:5'-nucleotidase